MRGSRLATRVATALLAAAATVWAWSGCAAGPVASAACHPPIHPCGAFEVKACCHAQGTPAIPDEPGHGWRGFPSASLLSSLRPAVAWPALLPDSRHLVRMVSPPHGYPPPDRLAWLSTYLI